MAKTKFVVLTPDEYEKLVEANKVGGFRYSFTPAELVAIREGNNVTLDLVMRAKHVINEATMKKLKYKSEFVERGELEGYVSRAEFLVLKATLDELMTKFFLTFKVLEKEKLVSEKKLIEMIGLLEKQGVKKKVARKKK